MLPGRLGRCNIRFPVLCFPGEAGGHDEEINQLMVLKQLLLAAVPRAFDKLDNAATQSVADTAGQHAKGRGAFPLPFPVKTTISPLSIVALAMLPSMCSFLRCIARL